MQAVAYPTPASASRRRSKTCERHRDTDKCHEAPCALCRRLFSRCMQCKRNRVVNCRGCLRKLWCEARIEAKRESRRQPVRHVPQGKRRKPGTRSTSPPPRHQRHRQHRLAVLFARGR